MKDVCVVAKGATHEVVDRTKKDAKSVTFYSVEILQPLRWVITFAAENAGADLGIPHRKNQYAITYNGSIFFNAPSYDRTPQPSTSLSLVSCPGHLALSSRTSWHRASSFLPSFLPESFERSRRYPFCWTHDPTPQDAPRSVPGFERKCQLGVDSLLGTFLLEWDGGLEDVLLREVELHCLRCR